MAGIPDPSTPLNAPEWRRALTSFGATAPQSVSLVTDGGLIAPQWLQFLRRAAAPVGVSMPDASAPVADASGGMSPTWYLAMRRLASQIG